MNEGPSRRSPAGTRGPAIGQTAAWIIGLAIAFFGWFVDLGTETTPYVLLLVVAPVCWLVRRRLHRGRRAESREPRHSGESAVDSERSAPNSQVATLNPSIRGILLAWTAAIVVAATSLAVSVTIAQQQVSGVDEPFGRLPPAYHDEYSYLFQAKTFLAGRLWFPSHPSAPRVFDQMHVLNEGKFASRYFPAVGAWIAPFLAMGHPYWGHWLAGALAAMLVFWSGRELAGTSVGLLAGLATAFSPGMGLFSNLLLAHHPALAGLTLFLFAFLRMMRRPHWAWALAAGIGLAFAMLARPMTAAGVGLPFGLWFAWWLVRGYENKDDPGIKRRAVVTACLAAPLLLGVVGMLGYNKAITGSYFKTPYQVYTETYTPRHVYGFNNVVRGEQHLGPKVLENYDRWAENLTPSLAARNVRNRLLASWQWTLGIVPVAMIAVVFPFVAGWLDRRWWLIAAAIVSLHLVHVPYWYEGIMHWHYVFESGPLWALLFAVVTVSLVRHWWGEGRRAMPVWWAAVVLLAYLMIYVPCEPVWGASRLRVGLENIAFSRKRYEAFYELIERRIPESGRPALVLVEPDPDDRHIDFVVNDPSLDSEILYGRVRQDGRSPEEIARLFPKRTCYYFRAKDWMLRQVSSDG